MAESFTLTNVSTLDRQPTLGGHAWLDVFTLSVQSWFASLPPPTVWMLINGAVGFGSGVETYGACKETIP